MTLGPGPNYCCNVAGITINKPDGSALLTAFGFGQSGSGTSTMVLPASGTYTMFVDPNSSFTGNVTLTLSEDLSPPISIGGPPVVLDVNRPGQNGYMTFTGTAGQRVSIGMSAVTLGPSPGYCCNVGTVAINNPDGSVLLATLGYNQAGGASNTMVLPASGTYTLLFDAIGSFTGSTTLTLSEDLSPPISIGGPSVVLNITRPGQNGYMSFTGTAGQRVSLGMSAVSLGPNPGYCCNVGTVAINKPDGSVLLATFAFNQAGNGTPTVILPVSGAYTILFDAIGSFTGSVTLTLSEDLSPAISIGGPSVVLAVSRPGQNGYMSFTGTAGQRVSIGMSAVSLGPNPGYCCNVGTVAINKPDGSVLLATLGYNQAGGASNTMILPVSGTYTLVFDAIGSFTGNTTLTLSEDLSPPISIGGPSVVLDISRPGQNGYLSFTGTAGQRVTVGMSAVSLGPNPGYCCNVGSVALFNPDGSTLLSSFGFNQSGNGTPTVILPASGNYTLVFDAVGSFTGSTTLTLSEDFSPAISIGGAPLVLNVSRPGQNGYMSFTGTAGQRVTLGMSAVTLGPNPGYCCNVASVAIYKPDGTALLSPLGFNQAGTATATMILPASGNYTIVFDPVSSFTGNVTLTLSEDLAAPITLNGSAVPLSLTRVGQNAILTFNGTASSQVTLLMTGNTIGGVTVTLIKPDGTTLALVNNGQATFSMSPQILPTTGVYTITVDPNVTNTGNINVAATSP